MSNKLEVIGFNIQSCMVAQQNGADRIELCHNPADGGTTPSSGFISAARELLHIELYPIIRPRGGDFLYGDEEYKIMVKDLLKCREMGCDGVVIGLLLADGSIDTQRSARLVELAYPMGVTFHRAFDRTRDPYTALEQLIHIGCERVLTSGLRPLAMEGTEVIRELILQADERIIVMPGSGVRSTNVELLLEQTGASEFHTSARVMAESNMAFLNVQMQEQLTDVRCDGEEVKKIAGIIKKIVL
jgi:copper homeostasis protein